MLSLICTLLNIYIVMLFGRIVLSWFPMSPGSALASVYSFLYTITEPVLGPIRRMMPGAGVGGMALDLSPIIVFFGIAIIQNLIGCGAAF